MSYFQKLASPSASAKAYLGALLAMLSAVAGMYAEEPIGKVAAILAAGVTALIGVYATKNKDQNQEPA